jgi:hypothetical protein
VIKINIRGIDRLEFGIDIVDYRKKYNAILLELKEKKETGQEYGFEQVVIYDNLSFEVALTGMRFYAYRIKCNDFMLAFAEKITEVNPPVRVTLYSGYLWSYGFEEAYKRFMDWFSIFPGVIEKTRVSRLDICVDTDEIDFNEEDLKSFVTRAKSKTKHFISDEYTTGRKFSGFTFGRGKPMLARIYNKTEEIKTKGKEWFKNIWSENGWNGESNLWRIEYQVRREALKELGLEHVEDIHDKKEELWHYLSTKWLSMNHKKWSVICKPNNAVIKPLIREKVTQGNIKRLTDQTNGLLISIGASTGRDNLNDVLKIIENQANWNLRAKRTNFTKEVQKRRGKYLKGQEN